MKKKQSRKYEVPEEFADILLVMDMGAKKYAPNNWLQPNGLKSDHVSRHDCVFHHLARSFAGEDLDEESGLSHKLHAAVGILMLYVREKRGIVHKLDKHRFKKKELMFLDEILESLGDE